MVGNVFGLLVSLIPLAVIVGVVVALVRSRRRADAEPRIDDGLGTVRRLFLYAVGLLALVLTGVGLSMLLGGLLDAVGGDTVIAEDDTELAVALSLTIVGVPAWLVVMGIGQRSVRRAREAELASEARRLYLNVARGIALVIVLVNGIGVAESLLRSSGFDGAQWGWLAVWLAFWVTHDSIIRAEPRTPGTAWLDGLYLAFGSVVGLSALLAGVSGALVNVLTAAYDAMFRSTLIRASWDADLRSALAPAFVGGAIWVLHWPLRLKRESHTGAAWQAAVFLFGVLPGVAMTLVAATVALHTSIDWWIGEPVDDAADHFDVLAGVLAVALVGSTTWAYFRSLVMERRAPGTERSDSERLYRYLVAAAGLVVLTIGLVAALALLIELVAPEDERVFRSEGWWRDQLVLAITLIGVGAPVWTVYWTGVQRSATGTPDERASLLRRGYIFAIFGVATVVLLVNLTIVLFTVFDAALGDGLTSEVLVDGRWSAALVLSAGIVAGYHWVVLREDQAAMPTAPAAPIAGRGPRNVVLVAPAGNEAVADALRSIEGVRLTVLRRRGDAAPAASGQVAAVLARAEERAGDCLVLIGAGGEADVIDLESAGRSVVSVR